MISLDDYSLPTRSALVPMDVNRLVVRLHEEKQILNSGWMSAITKK